MWPVKGIGASVPTEGVLVVLRAVFRRVRTSQQAEVSGEARQVAGATVPGVRKWVAGLATVAIVAGSFVGLSATVASAATTPFTMNMTAGEFGVHSNPPATLPPPGSLAGSEDHTTGVISGATISLSPYHTTNTHSTETIFIRQVTAGTATGLLSYTGTLRITDTLSALVTIHSPVTEHCTSEPIHVNLTGHYDSTTHTATISQTNFVIPLFTTCGLAKTSLDTRFAGSTGNVMSLTLQGTLVPPPPPAAPTTTTLAVTPTSPVLAGTSVTLTATVTSGGQLATKATGTVKFMVGSTQIGATQTLAAGTASVTTTTLPTVTGQTLTAVYSGDTTYATSTSAPRPYVVQPKPTVGLSTTALSATRGSATPTPFSVVITNPTTGEGFNSVWLQLRMNGISGLRATQVTLSYENSAHTWCPVTLTGRKQITGTFKGTSGACNSAASFALPADGQPMVIPFEISYAANANVGPQTFVVSLQTVSGSTIVAPFTAATTATVPLHGPYAKGTLTALPATKFTVTVTATPPSTAIPEGYVVPVHPTIAHPATTTPHTIYYPQVTGTVTFLIDGHVTPTSPVKAGTAAFTEARPSTAGLAPGSHTLEVKYGGSSIYNAGQVTTTFTVTTAAPGTAFVCNSAVHSVIDASVVASGTVPTTSNTKQATVSGLQVVLHTDPHTGPTTTTTLSTALIGFSPGGSIAAPSISPTRAGGIVTSSWTGLTGTVTTVNGPPGTVVPVAVTSLSFVQDGLRFSCTANPTPVVLGSVTVSGVTLAGSPASPVAAGTPVTLTATVGPASNGGQVNFFEVHGTTTTNIGTVPVANGTAALVVAPTAGAHTYRATWAGIVPVAVSNTLTYTATAAPVVITQPAHQTVTAGQTASFSAAATGTPTPTVQWQVSTNGSTWSTITGATGTTYAIPVTTAADNGHQYRAVFTNSGGTATTNAATLVVVSPPSVVAQPANQTVAAGSTATFSAKATGTVLSVQWQTSTDGGASWSNAPGAPKNTFASATTLTSTYTSPASAGNGTQYRAVFTNGLGTATSNAATLTVTTTPPPPPPPHTTTTTTPVTTTGGYHLVAANGSVYSYGNAPFYGSMGGQALNKPIVGVATTPGDGGYWLVASDGGIFSFGNAAFYGSMGGKPLNQPIVGIASTPDGKGYWEVASDGGIFAFGDAAFYGSMGGKPLNQPIVGIASTPDGKGYWEVASDGGIFSFGDAAFSGSTGSLKLNKPIVGMASTNNGAGYWLVASDGGVFAFGSAGFHGTVAGTTSASIVSLVPTADNGGYWETGANGQVFQFGDATSAGTALAQTATIVAMSD